VDIHYIHDIGVYVILLKREEYQGTSRNIVRTYMSISFIYWIRGQSAKYDEMIRLHQRRSERTTAKQWKIWSRKAECVVIL